MSAPNSIEVRRKRKRPAASRSNVPEFDFEMEINLDQHSVMMAGVITSWTRWRIRGKCSTAFSTGSSSSDFILELDDPSVVSDAGIIMADPPKKNKEKKSSTKKGKKHSDGVALKANLGLDSIQGENHSLDFCGPKSDENTPASRRPISKNDFALMAIPTQIRFQRQHRQNVFLSLSSWMTSSPYFSSAGQP